MNECRKQLEKIIRKVKPDLEIDDFTGKNFFEDLEFDSVDIVTLMVEIEEEFGFEFPEEDVVENIVGFDKLVEYIEEKLANK